MSNSSLYSDSKFLTILSQLTGGSICENTLVIPEKMGTGFIKTYKIGTGFDLMVQRYQLHEDFTINRTANKSDNVITFSFRHLSVLNPEKKKQGIFPTVQITSSDIDLEISIPANTDICTIIISIQLSILQELLRENDNHFLYEIISKEEPYIYEEFILPEMHGIANEIIQLDHSQSLFLFLLRIKSENLIYLFLLELSKRKETMNYPINNLDFKIINRVRDKILSNLSVAPNLSELAYFANMSQSKMNRLFKQIFGNSIYNYYQSTRINEAKNILSHEKTSIAEVGHRLGFTNMSHFARVFERYTGFKPKKYSSLK